MTCVRDLAVVDASWRQEEGADIKLPISDGSVAPEFEGKIVNEISSKYAAQGELARARADALKYCKDLSRPHAPGPTPSARGEQRAAPGAR